MKNLTKLTAVVLLLVMVSLVSLSGTYAKYTGSVEGQGVATVAKWIVGVNGTNINENTATFNLFNNVLDTNGVTTFAAGATITDDDVLAVGASGNRLIAPGTWGYDVIEISYQSEVNSYGTVTISDFTSEAPVELALVVVESLDEATVTASDFHPMTAPITAGDYLEASNQNLTYYAVLFWKWDFELDDARDVSDTALGFNPSDATVTGTLSITQVD